MALAAGVTMVQLRGHQLSTARRCKLAQTLHQRCRFHQAAFLVNDRLDIGSGCGADGFQLGGHSFPLPLARRLVGDDYLFGASVHSLGEAQAAVAAGADFLLAGTIFASRSHPGVAGHGPAFLSLLKSELPTCPVFAIGGITSANAGQVMEAGADGIAVISAILDAANIPQAVDALRRALFQPEKGCAHG
jgi:thiamine-phosphate pyrophosphorylase